MSIETLFIYFLSFVSILFALLVVTQRKIIRTVSSLMVVLIATAGMYVILKAEFLTGVQVLVYVGGIVVLLTFAIMLTGAGHSLDETPSLNRKLFALVFSGGFFLASFYSITHSQFVISNHIPNLGVKDLGLKLLDYGPTGFVLPFEVISILLLAVLIGAIVISHKEKKEPQKEKKLEFKEGSNV